MPASGCTVSRNWLDLEGGPRVSSGYLHLKREGFKGASHIRLLFVE